MSWFSFLLFEWKQSVWDNSESLLHDGEAHFNPHEANVRCQNCHFLDRNNAPSHYRWLQTRCINFLNQAKTRLSGGDWRRGSANGLVSLKDEVINDRMKNHLWAIIKCFQQMRLKKKKKSIRGTTLLKKHTLCKVPASLWQKAIVLVICLEIPFPALMGKEGTNNHLDYF